MPGVAELPKDHAAISWNLELSLSPPKCPWPSASPPQPWLLVWGECLVIWSGSTREHVPVDAPGSTFALSVRGDAASRHFAALAVLAFAMVSA